jgi:hypothetical protein
VSQINRLLGLDELKDSYKEYISNRLTLALINFRSGRIAFSETIFDDKTGALGKDFIPYLHYQEQDLTIDGEPYFHSLMQNTNLWNDELFLREIKKVFVCSIIMNNYIFTTKTLNLTADYDQHTHLLLLADQGLKVEQIYNKNFNNQEEQNLYFHLLSLSVNEVIEK